jgi:L-seryl-tRNA(Ser) seleniumtransferase
MAAPFATVCGGVLTVDALRALPSVHQVLEQPDAQALIAVHGRALVLFAVQRTLDQERSSGAIAEPAARLARIEGLIRDLRRPRLRPVINATGVVLHTNLGRAPLAPAAAHAAAEIAARYSTLEFDPKTGRRGRRHDLVAGILRYLTGAEAAAVVNNCAAAVLLMLTALAKGKEVIVGRGELVEIGGGFRMPDVMRLSGARLVEVGTTNRTRPEDYADAVTPKTVAIMKVHASNFQVVGFTESVEIEALARVARQHRVLLLHDLGSGSLLDTTAYGLTAEPRIQDSLRSGTDLLACSGDKLLGGPQAGLLLGRTEVVEKVMKHPLARAVRIDKLTLAALTATLDLYLTQSVAEVPIWNMLGASSDAIAARAKTWQHRLTERGIAADLVAAESTVGGGSLPGERLPTTALAIAGRPGRAADLLRRLREHEPPVIGRIEQERVLLDPRTVLPDEDDALLDAVVAALA